MDVDFLGQPWQDGSNLDDFFNDVTGEPAPDRLRIAVAWAKRSGLSRVRPYLETWRTNGGVVHLIIGLSEGGATRQGLEEALQAADSVHLFHDVAGRTFHPKVYLAETGSAATLLVGSNNLTAGGLYFNYEAGITVRVPAEESHASALQDQVNSWFNLLMDDKDCCRELTVESLPALLANSAYRIGDEDNRRKAAAGDVDAPEEVDSVTPTEDEVQIPFFDRSTSQKRGARHALATPALPATGAGQTSPTPEPGTGSTGSVGSTPPAIPTQPPQPPPVPSPARAAVERWSKRMRGTDAQQPPGTDTQPTYNLRLAAARHPIDITTYFRDDFFDVSPWHTDPSDPSIEYTTVDMEVFVYGQLRGTYRFRIDHDLDRVSGQGNVPTVLKWGPLSDYMLHNDHVDDWVLLEKYDDDTYALLIESSDPGTT